MCELERLLCKHDGSLCYMPIVRGTVLYFDGDLKDHGVLAGVSSMLARWLFALHADCKGAQYYVMMVFCAA